MISVKQKVAIISELRRIISLNLLLKVAGVARSTYYYHKHAKRLDDKYSTTKVLISAIFRRHKGRYGYRRVRRELVNSGVIISPKTVLRLMNELGMLCTKKPKEYKSYRGSEGEAAPNILRRKFDANAPNVKWVTDVTEFRIGSSKLYLSPIIDLFNREVVSYGLSEKPLFGLVAKMLTDAFKRLGDEEGPILHSDQGWQYRMGHYRQMLKEHSATISMSRKGNCYDNAVAESFFATLKSEMFHGEEFQSVEHLKASIIDYIKYYNNDRIKLSLGGMSPVAYRINQQSF